MHDPYQLLVGVERRAQAAVRPLPRQEAVRTLWPGVAFRIAGQRLVAPLAEVAEILYYPELTRVPGTKPWVRGIANVRGNLLPIMDLRGYLYGERTPTHRRSRVLVVSHRGLQAGLLVDEVMGIRHFDEADRLAEVPEADEPLRPYLRRGYRDEEGTWPVFSMFRLAENPLFLQAAG